jgi:hypothetical protein
MVALVAGAAPAVAAPPSGGTWSAAKELKFPAAPHVAVAGTSDESCAPGGTCTTIGSYSTKAKSSAAVPFAVTSVRGKYGQPEAIGTSGLVNGQFGSHGPTQAVLDLVSCLKAGDCTVLGAYHSPKYGVSPFSVTEENGKWGKATPIPGVSAFGKSFALTFSELACPSAGNCVAGGMTWNGYKGMNSQPFLLAEVHGTWGQVQEVKGIPAPGQLEAGGINSVSCTAAGTCLAAGGYSPNAGGSFTFVVTEQDGTWGTAQTVPGLSPSDAFGPLSCAPQGTCTAVGASKKAGQTFPTLFAVSETGGHWGSAHNFPDSSGFIVTGLDCPANGDCVVGGWQEGPKGSSAPFLITERNGTWTKPQVVPGLAALTKGKVAGISSVSCGAPGNCTATGYLAFRVGRNYPQAETIVMTETNGVWGKAILLPGLVALDGNTASQNSTLACFAADHCTVTGEYSTPKHQAFSYLLFVSSES